jgi:DNA-binding NarL/FixJ family response regulator
MGSIKHKTQNDATPTSQKTWRTLIVDDHPLFRDGLRELLENEPGIEICGEAESEDEAFELFRQTDADLVTVDISLAAGHGLNLVSRIKKARPSTVVLVLSMFDDRVYAERALATGAAGYVCKQATNQQLIAAFRTVRQGEIYLSEDIFQQVLQRKLAPKFSADKPETEQLSRRELQIYTMIGQGRTTHQIATELHLAVSTVETYRERLKSKLGLASGAELTRHAILWVTQKM